MSDSKIFYLKIVFVKSTCTNNTKLIKIHLILFHIASYYSVLIKILAHLKFKL